MQVTDSSALICHLGPVTGATREGDVSFCITKQTGRIVVYLKKWGSHGDCCS